MAERLTLHWLSFLLHCFGMTLLLLAFAMPHWFTHEEGANEFENGGLWRRCRVGGGCVPLKDASEDLAFQMTPTQVLVTIAFVCGLVSTLFFALWLWKGEMCDTPWKKRCDWCAETYVRSRKPKTAASAKYRRMKWAAFSFSFFAGLLCGIGVIIFMVNLLLKSEGQSDSLGWCTWVALAAAVLLMVTNLVIGVCSYLMRYPERDELELDDNVEAKLGEYDLGEEREVGRIHAWIMEQKSGLDNPSFSRDWESARHNSLYSNRSFKSTQSRQSGVYYVGQNESAVLDRSAYSLPSMYQKRSYQEQYPRRIAPFASAHIYSPMYSVMFRGKIPMIPKKPLTPETKFIYDTIYGFNKDDVPPVLTDHSGNELPPKVIKDRIRRPASHLGITLDARKLGADDIYDCRGRPMSDSNLAVGAWRPRRRHMHSASVDDLNHRRASTPDLGGPFEPGEIPSAYRRRKHPERRSTTSLSTANTSQEHNTSFGCRVRTKFPEESDEDEMELPLSYVLSHGMQGLDLAGSSNFELDNIWVVPSKEEIPEVLGKSRVHFKLEKSIQELDEFDLEMADLQQKEEEEKGEDDEDDDDESYSTETESETDA